MINYTIIISTKDIAGMNIRDCLISDYGFEESGEVFKSEPIYINGNVRLITIETETVYSDNIDLNINDSSDLIIFASRHRSHDGRAIFSCHAPGNWNRAELGGKEKKLCVSPAILLKKAYLKLKEKIEKDIWPEGFDLTLECTHHGPYMEKPCIFIEIGSTEEQWRNKGAGNIIASVIMEIIDDDFEDKNDGEKIAFGIGGTHYCSEFNKVLEETAYNVGHICPKYMLSSLDKDMIIQALSKSSPISNLVVLDWKGLGSEKERIISLLDELKIEYKTTKQIRKKD